MSDNASVRLIPALVSVTFRQLSPEKIVALACSAKLHAIEWGGDVHVPHGDLNAARRVRDCCENAGLRIYAYGSYYRVGGAPSNPDFHAVLETAQALGTDSVRVWAGGKGTAEADDATVGLVRSDLRRICDLAAPRGLSIDLEYHDGTLTDSAESAVKLVDSVDRSNLRCYWQPRHGFSVEQNLAEIQLLGERLANIHVFHWWPDPRTRLALQEGADRWRSYFRVLSAKRRFCALEFVHGDDPARFLEDARTLRTLLAEI